MSNPNVVNEVWPWDILDNGPVSEVRSNRMRGRRAVGCRTLIKGCCVGVEGEDVGRGPVIVHIANDQELLCSGCWCYPC